MWDFRRQQRRQASKPEEAEYGSSDGPVAWQWTTLGRWKRGAVGAGRGRRAEGGRPGGGSVESEGIGLGRAGEREEIGAQAAKREGTAAGRSFAGSELFERERLVSVKRWHACELCSRRRGWVHSRVSVHGRFPKSVELGKGVAIPRLPFVTPEFLTQFAFRDHPFSHLKTLPTPIT